MLEVPHRMPTITVLLRQCGEHACEKLLFASVAGPLSMIAMLQTQATSAGGCFTQPILDVLSYPLQHATTSVGRAFAVQSFSFGASRAAFVVAHPPGRILYS